MLHIGFGDEGAIDELLVLRPSREYAPSLQSCNDGRDGCLRQLSLGVQLLPYLGDGQLALIPEKAQDRDLELGQRLAVGHAFGVRVSTGVDSTCVERGGQEESFELQRIEDLTAHYLA